MLLVIRPLGFRSARIRLTLTVRISTLGIQMKREDKDTYDVQLYKNISAL